MKDANVPLKLLPICKEDVNVVSRFGSKRLEYEQSLSFPNNQSNLDVRAANASKNRLETADWPIQLVSSLDPVFACSFGARTSKFD